MGKMEAIYFDVTRLDEEKLELEPHMLTENIREKSDIEWYGVHIKPKRKGKKGLPK
jgi:hypothetical protein